MSELDGMEALSEEDAYRRMLRIRRFEERTLELKQAEQIPGSVHLCVGQEAIPVGACSTLVDGDVVTATYRGHGWALEFGVPMNELFAEMMGRESSINGGRAGSPYLSAARHGFVGENSIVAGGLPIALGCAMAFWQLEERFVSMVSVGDGALNQGAAHEALNFAAAFALPLVVVLENNQYSEMTPWREMVAVDRLVDRAAAYGMPGTQVDGNDPFTVRAAVLAAVDRARLGGGPSLIECTTERLVGHYSGDAQAYRPKGEIASAQEREPLVSLRNRAFRGAADDHLRRIHREVEDEVDASVKSAFAMATPNVASVMEHVYA